MLKRKKRRCPPNDQVQIIDVDGEEFTLIDPGDTDLDYDYCFTLRDLFDWVLENHRGDVIVDLSKTPYLDSSGLGLLLTMLKTLGVQSRHLILVVGNNDIPVNVLNMTRLNGLFSLVKCREEAVEHSEPSTQSI